MTDMSHPIGGIVPDLDRGLLADTTARARLATEVMIHRAGTAAVPPVTGGTGAARLTGGEMDLPVVMTRTETSGSENASVRESETVSVNAKESVRGKGSGSAKLSERRRENAKRSGSGKQR